MRTLFCAVLTFLIVFISAGTPLAAQQLGDALTLNSPTKVSEITKDPEKFVGQTVLIEGLVVDVCAKRGCWMDMASDTPFEKIQIKVVDGVIVFPMSAKGKHAKVEGVVEALRLSQEDARELAEHKAEEKGIDFDPESIQGPQTTYRIRGLGAVIE